MKIVLRADVEHLGRKGDVIDVADGYARNYLVPRGLALRADRGVVRQAEAMRRNREARDARERAAAEALAARVGESGRLFGSVTAADIAEHLEALVGHPVDRRRIELPEPVKQVGRVTVEVRLHPEVRANLTVEVVPA